MSNISSPINLIPKNSKTIEIMHRSDVIDCLVVGFENDNPTGYAIVLHPDPNAGGTYTNKVVQSVAKTLCSIGYICYCPNFRGVGKSSGSYGNVLGELEDARLTYQYAKNLHGSEIPLIISGFSFGAMIASKLAFMVDGYKQLILIAPAVSRYDVSIHDVDKTFVIHGREDEVILFDDAMKWSDTQNQVVISIPNTTHFFHGKLGALSKIVYTIAAI